MPFAPINAYPDLPRARDKWVLERRPGRGPARDAFQPHGFFDEQERSATGAIEWFSTVFLTNRECPWRCVMCDLWKTTVLERVPAGAIPAQIEHALQKLACQSRQPRGGIKLYNGGSFFDPKAIPPEDDGAIAKRIGAHARVIVECHPAFVSDRCLRFRDLLASAASCAGLDAPAPRLEVAMGLETADPTALEKLNKRMTLEDFASAARVLREGGVDLRAFVLVQPPFQDEAAAASWVIRSIEFAFDHGATVVSLIPTRLGNGATEALAAQGLFVPPKLSALETALAAGIELGRGRVFADLWDLEKFSACAACYPARLERLRLMNLEQSLPSEVVCSHCGNGRANGR